MWWPKPTVFNKISLISHFLRNFSVVDIMCRASDRSHNKNQCTFNDLCLFTSIFQIFQDLDLFFIKFTIFQGFQWSVETMKNLFYEKKEILRFQLLIFWFLSSSVTVNWISLDIDPHFTILWHFTDQTTHRPIKKIINQQWK